MAKFTAELPTDILKDVNFLENNAIDIFKGMTKAGAEVAAENMKRRVGQAFKSDVAAKINSRLRVTKSYETRKKEIATAARFYGYIPRKNGSKVKIKGKYGYGGVPVPLLVALKDQGRSVAFTMPAPLRGYWTRTKYPITVPAFADGRIEQVMLKAQKELSGGLLE